MRHEVDDLNNDSINLPTKERALVLHGRGALGACEAGAYKALYEWLSKKDKNEGRKETPIFDIIAGTSIGAMNAAASQATLLKMVLMKALQRDL